jgi:hypothetical protein
MFLKKKIIKKKIFSAAPLPQGNITQKLLNNYQIGILTVLIKKELFQKYQFDDSLEIIGDFDLFLKISKSIKVGCIQKSLACVRIHKSNLSLIKTEDFIDELSYWLRNKEDSQIFKGLSFQGVIINLQCQKIKKLILNSKRVKALLQIIKSPISIRKLKFIFFLILPLKIIREKFEL